MARMFGTDGVRGIANQELTPELAMKLGRAGAYVLGENASNPTILIAKDTRISGDMLEDALCAGILSMGVNVIKAGVLPTPAAAYLTIKYGASAGAVISASHNPFEYNGIKFFNSKGFKLDDDLEDRIEKIVKGEVILESKISGNDIGRIIEPSEDPNFAYRSFVKSTFDGSLEGMKIVLDCANGAASYIAPDVFVQLGAYVAVLNAEPDGININKNCGSTHPEALCDRVVKEGADIGLAFDGDADRLIAVDEKGRVIDGDRTIGICAKLLKEEGRLVNDSVTVTVMSNIGFHKRAEELGINVEVTAVGDRYVLENMLKTGCVIGGEQSGHIICLEYGTTGDGMVAALQLLRAYKKYGISLSELADEISIYPQVLVNARVNNEKKFIYNEIPRIREAIEQAESDMDGDGRVLIRPSGTEPLVRVMIEGSDTERIAILANRLAQLIEKELA